MFQKPVGYVLDMRFHSREQASSMVSTVGYEVLLRGVCDPEHLSSPKKMKASKRKASVRKAMTNVKIVCFLIPWLLKKALPMRRRVSHKCLFERMGKDCRMAAMELVGETRKRKPEDGESSDSKKKKERRSSNDMIGFLEKRSTERQAATAAELKIREKEAENRNEESKAVTGGILQMMTVMQDQINQNRQREEQDRREREEERRLQREQQSQQSQQLTALLGALINKLDN